ncbi:hypothetical protein HYE54_12440 [Aggregatibacter actinomycetemcomitans]|uniref:hypothetical protein n=1 Tax=Aggregatibacter actinomycetemcomitans TaxID=714 RepID=UPI00197B6331|nr:hypothetical protein [Aggregatibacter actinomycetemcomitans]MBN6068865.1 hypothetical protein [Aggregatibacter actinomycetemcomitans]MBN6068951.1 hypothetical protein [Aggregatibacter actinomycetemcomitans]MBN6069017.1 hypothetical protein [Aggregatibacter actinomycetemcomitans]MBN6069499.1 hypothetical protein [Aggregatibacter actinomycetemcomitans]MBN6086860.1 hypothetical protein [Aggregatibacter actinomycetemcomitans]
MANKYTLEVLANDGGFRGLIIDTKTKLVERRTRIQKTKTDAFNALTELVEEFLNTYLDNEIKGVSKLDGAFFISQKSVWGME